MNNYLCFSYEEMIEGYAKNNYYNHEQMVLNASLHLFISIARVVYNMSILVFTSKSTRCSFWKRLANRKDICFGKWYETASKFNPQLGNLIGTVFQSLKLYETSIQTSPWSGQRSGAKPAQRCINRLEKA